MGFYCRWCGGEIAKRLWGWSHVVTVWPIPETLHRAEPI